MTASRRARSQAECAHSERLHMNHQDHIGLLRAGVLDDRGRPVGYTWADLGSGAGTFTLALADLLGPGGEIYSVDRDGRALREQERAMRSRFPQTVVHYQVADFTRPLSLPPLDGIVMANSLHFVPQAQKEAVVRQIRGYLHSGGRFILVEYNADGGNFWVPYPLSYPSWERLASQAGFADTRLLGSVPSRFFKEIYAALSW